MSNVTDVIITMSFYEILDGTNDCPAIEFLNKWLIKENSAELNRVDKYSGGMAFQAIVFMGAINNLILEEFMSAFKEAPWEYKDGVSLFVKTEYKERFSDITPPLNLWSSKC